MWIVIVVVGDRDEPRLKQNRRRCECGLLYGRAQLTDVFATANLPLILRKESESKKPSIEAIAGFGYGRKMRSIHILVSQGRLNVLCGPGPQCVCEARIVVERLFQILTWSVTTLLVSMLEGRFPRSPCSELWNDLQMWRYQSIQHSRACFKCAVPYILVQLKRALQRRYLINIQYVSSSSSSFNKLIWDLIQNFVEFSHIRFICMYVWQELLTLFVRRKQTNMHICNREIMNLHFAVYVWKFT